MIYIARELVAFVIDFTRDFIHMSDNIAGRVPDLTGIINDDIDDVSKNSNYIGN